MGSQNIRWTEVTAVFGGTFDPPHLGHLEAINGLHDAPGVGRVLVIPSGSPALKTTQTPALHRWAMTEIAFGSTNRTKTIPLEILPIEIERSRLKPDEPSYTFDTLNELKRTFQNLAFVVGTDQLVDLERWHRFPEILTLCHWIVLERKDSNSQIGYSTLQKWTNEGLLTPQSDLRTQWQVLRSPSSTVIKVVPTPARALSSSEVRQAIQKTGVAPEGAINPQVLDYMKKHGLYGLTPSEVS